MASVAKLRDDPEPATAGKGNAHARLAAARIQLHNGGIKKTGSAPNRRGGYFELGDFIVPAQVALRDNGLVGVVSYGDGVASLEIVNIDDSSDRIRIESPLGSAKLPNCHEVQNIGAVQTYQRRYLWMTALEIVEHDALEGSEVDDGADANRSDVGSVARPVSDTDWAKIVMLCQSTGTQGDEVKRHIGAANLKVLTAEQFTTAIDYLEAKLAKMAKDETNAKAGG